jgi:hypothetical protein
MNHNSVTPNQIQALRSRVTIQFSNPEGTTSTFAHAFLDGTFYLATGHSACVDPANFDAEKGKRYAAENLEPKILGQLWQFEGYSLYQRLRDTAGLVATTTADPEPAPPPPVAPTAVTDAHVNAFLSYPLPADVRPDVTPGSPHNSGTNLLDWEQAKAMLEHVFSFGQKAEDPPADTWLDRLRAEQAELAARVVKLNAFLDGHGAPTDADEALLRRQASLMDQLDDVLLERIARALATAPVATAVAKETQA